MAKNCLFGRANGRFALQDHVIQLGVRVRGIAIEMYGERGQHGTKPAVVRD